MTLPVCIADHHGSAAARLHFFSRGEAAGEWPQGEDTKKLGTHAGYSAIFRCRGPNHGSFPGAVIGHRLERGTLVAPVLELSCRDLLGKRSACLVGRRKIGESYNSIRIAIRKGF